MTTPPLPEQIELHRDRMWQRDEDLRVESAVEAERFIEDVGFANTLTDARRAGIIEERLTSQFTNRREFKPDPISAFASRLIRMTSAPTLLWVVITLVNRTLIS